MTQDKMRRIITACVSAATVLFVFLLSFLIYQWITIGVLNKKIAKKEAEVAYWEQELAEAETTLDFYESEFYLNWAIQELNQLKGQK